MLSFRTEGGPLLVGSASRAQRWRGARGGSGETVLTYSGIGWDSLPKHLRPKKAGKAERVFASAEEAEATVAELTRHFLSVTPRARRLPEAPNHTFWYLEGRRVFGYELSSKNDLALAQALTKRGPAESDGLLFFPVEPGELRCTVGDGSLTLETGTLGTSKPKRSSLTHDAGELWIFPAGLAAADLKKKKPSALLVPDQAAPGGAFLSIPAKKLGIVAREGRLEVSWT